MDTVALPGLRDMVVGEPLGSVRGERFLRAVDTLIEMAGERPHADGMIAAEWPNHQTNDVSAAQFQRYFDADSRVFRQALGDDWSPQIDNAWQSRLRQVHRLAVQGALQP